MSAMSAAFVPTFTRQLTVHGRPAAWRLGNNVLNALYYDYAIASAFTDGRFSAYPLPGRTYMVKAGATF